MTIPRNTLFIKATGNGEHFTKGDDLIFKHTARGWFLENRTTWMIYTCSPSFIRTAMEHFTDNVQIITAAKVDLLKPLYGDDIAEDLYTWYRRAYPWDTIAEDINAKVTFYDIWAALVQGHGRDIYDYIGADDSIVRERVFTRLSELLNKPYDFIHELWLNNAA